MYSIYRKNPKFLDRQALSNSADLDQTAPRGGVFWSGATLFAIPSVPFGQNSLWKDVFDWILASYQQTFEPRHEKTNILHMQKQRRRSASR